MRVHISAIVVVLIWVSLSFGQNANLDRTVDHFVLDTVSVSAADLSPDGKWVAVTAASLRDRIGVNNARFGDPSYIAPSVAEVRVIETSTGKAQNLYTNKRQVRAFKWSPDSGKLAFFVLNGESFEPAIWTRTTAKIQSIKLPAGKEAADNAEFEWSPDSNELIFAVRPSTWRAEAA